MSKHFTVRARTRQLTLLTLCKDVAGPERASAMRAALRGGSDAVLAWPARRACELRSDPFPHTISDCCARYCRLGMAVPVELTVMTRNLYFGADTSAILGAPNAG